MKKLDLTLVTGSPEKGDQPAQQEEAAAGDGAKGAPNLALNLDLMKRPDQTADLKEKMYDGYDASSSRQKGAPALGKPAARPKFSLNMAGITGEATQSAPADQNAAGEETITGSGTVGVTPGAAAKAAGRFANLADNVSNVSASPLAAGPVSNRFRARMGAGGIPTPLGSDMSRAKFDFSGYDPAVMRKKKEPSPERKVITKIEEDMEVFITDTREDPDAVNLDKRNAESAEAARSQVVKEIFSLIGDSTEEDQGNIERIAEVQAFQT